VAAGGCGVGTIGKSALLRVGGLCGGLYLPVFCSARAAFMFWKGFADAAVGVILLMKPKIIYHSAVAKALHRFSGLRLPNPHPTSPGEISSQHAVAILVRLHLYRASREH
jgi:hypothetical protein